MALAVRSLMGKEMTVSEDRRLFKGLPFERDDAVTSAPLDAYIDGCQCPGCRESRERGSYPFKLSGTDDSPYIPGSVGERVNELQTELVTLESESAREFYTFIAVVFGIGVVCGAAIGWLIAILTGFV
jgi:hypothetical protein